MLRQVNHVKANDQMENLPFRAGYERQRKWGFLFEHKSHIENGRDRDRSPVPEYLVTT